jgi:hypothetical protein
MLAPVNRVLSLCHTCAMLTTELAFGNALSVPAACLEAEYEFDHRLWHVGWQNLLLCLVWGCGIGLC